MSKTDATAGKREPPSSVMSERYPTALCDMMNAMMG
jgi:hypothetical protein